jgi:outer membrane protein OmpA-like peptidoglycan-associated protein
MRTHGGGTLPVALLGALLLAGAGARAADAQLGGILKQKAKEAVEKAVRCAAGDEACIAKAKREGKKVEIVQEEGGAVAEPAAGGAPAAAPAGAADRPGEGAWARFDFVPGERILYADDFTGDEVGDFPRRMEFKEGALEIVEWKGARWLRATEDSKFYLVLPEPLPQRFTMEFDYAIPSGEVWITFAPEGAARLDFGGAGSARLSNRTNQVSAEGRYDERNERNAVRRARVLADGRYVKVYLDDKRILNVPNADLERTNKILFFTDGTPNEPTLFGNFRVAAGGRKLYDALAEKGRVATQGILFDVGSDRIRGESTPTLKEIAAMLKEHPELRLMIEGHTDNVGSAESNQALAEKRAAAVKAHLVGTGVEAARLESKGFGAAKPAAPNDTPEGRQTNRRVELVKL